MMKGSGKNARTGQRLQLHENMSLVMRKPVFGVSDQVHTNRPVQPQKIVTGLKFQIWIVEGLYYPYSENKGADQLRDYREADLRLCFRICRKLVFSRHGSNMWSQSKFHPCSIFLT